MVMRMLCCLLTVFALTGALQPGYAEILDYDEYMADQPAGMDGLFVLDAGTAVLTGDAVLDNGQISIDKIGSVTYGFTAETDCAYQLEITCRSIEGKRNDVEYAVLVDGAIPFSEAPS